MHNMYIRIAQIINSCKTIPQLKSAKNYLDLWWVNGRGNYLRRTFNRDIRSYGLLKNEIDKRIRELQNA